MIISTAAILLGANAFPLLASLLELVRSDLRHDEVHLHEALLFGGQVGVSRQLLRDTLAELVPVQVADQLLQVLLIELISLLEGIHVDFHQVFMLKCFGQGELGCVVVLDLVQVVVETVQNVDLLDFES